MVSNLILTVTRRCNLRCAYCPTVKDGWPELSAEQAVRGLELYADRYGGGDIKLFGGEPLLVPNVVRAVFEAARDNPHIRWVYLSTNGLGLDLEWLEFLRAYPKGILTVSMDGLPEDHRRLRRSLPGVSDAYGHVVSLMPELRKTPRVVVTQTIAPKTAGRAEQNFRHLVELGFRRFNLLPGYYLPWREAQLEQLRAGFDGIANVIREHWAADKQLYLRNLFTYAPTPFFNTGLVIDSDATIHPSNVGLSGKLDALLGKTEVGTLDNPPSLEELQERERQVNELLKNELPERVWSSTMAVDAELTRMCEGLYPDYVAYRKRRKVAKAKRKASNSSEAA